MMGGDIHPLSKIEAMGAEALHSGIELELRATRGAGLGNQPVEKQVAMPVRAGVTRYDEIIHIKKSAPGEIFGIPVTATAYDLAIVLDIGEKITFALLANDLLDKGFQREMRPQFQHDGETTRDLFAGPGETNVGFHQAARIAGSAACSRFFAAMSSSSAMEAMCAKCARSCFASGIPRE